MEKLQDVVSEVKFLHLFSPLFNVMLQWSLKNPIGYNFDVWQVHFHKKKAFLCILYLKIMVCQPNFTAIHTTNQNTKHLKWQLCRAPVSCWIAYRQGPLTVEWLFQSRPACNQWQKVTHKPQTHTITDRLIQNTTTPQHQSYTHIFWCKTDTKDAHKCMQKASHSWLDQCERS